MNDTNTSSGFRAYLTRTPIVVSAAVIALGLLVCAVIGSYTFYSIRAMENQLSVTGSAKQSIKADRAKWVVSVSRPVTASTLRQGYAQIASDLTAVKSFFAKNGFPAEQLTVSTVSMDEVYENYAPAPDQKKYNLRQTVQIMSDDVEKISALSKNIQEVISQGVLFSVQAPEYSYSDLATLRVSLLSEALKDAKDRAESIAGVAGNSVGKLKSAASGVVQVLPAGSVDVSDYGAYDMSGIDKEVMVTVRASFSIR